MKSQRGVFRFEVLARFFVFSLLAYYCWKITPAGTVQDSVVVFSKKIIAGEWGFVSEVGECFERSGRYFPAYSPLYSLTPVPLLLLSGNRLQLQHFNLAGVLAAAVLLWFYMRSRPGLRSYADISVLLFILATPMAHNIREGNVWHFMHTLSNLALITALLALRYRWWFVLGLALGYASMVRMALIPGVGLLVLLLSLHFCRKKAFNIRPFLLCVAGIAIPLGLNLVLQFAMTGSFLKSPYEVAWDQWGQHRAHGTLSLNYFPGNLSVYFGQLPRFLDDFPWTKFDGHGQSLWWLCPWLFSALFARCGDLPAKATVFLVITTALFYLFYYYSGYHQFGTRYWTDFMVLWVILALNGWDRLCGAVCFTPRTIFFRCAFVFLALWSFALINLIAFLWGKITF